VTDLRDLLFDALSSGARLADGLLAADRRVAEGRLEYDDGYYEAFFAEARPLVERRVSDAITAVAGVIEGAWAEAGKPNLSAPLPRPAQKIRGRDVR
jgi:hypothetical protein